jgi:hypothetical protein
LGTDLKSWLRIFVHNRYVVVHLQVGSFNFIAMPALFENG